MIGLTGGIASGKSTVSARLVSLGARVLDADVVSRGVIANPSVLESIRKEFGESVFFEDGSLDRAALASAAFADEESVKKLDAITHPAIAAELLKAAEEAGKNGCSPVFVDAALLIESGFNAYCDGVWLVTAPVETRLKRVMERDGLSPEAAADRIARQASDEEKMRFATVVIENRGSVEELYERVDREYSKLLAAVQLNEIRSAYEEE